MGRYRHGIFTICIDYLNAGRRAGNQRNARAFPRGCMGERESGGACEVLLLKQLAPKRWEDAGASGKKLQPGAVVHFGGGRLTGDNRPRPDRGGRPHRGFCVRGHRLRRRWTSWAKCRCRLIFMKSCRIGSAIRRCTRDEEGSAAAPTAGLHFTPELLDAIRAKGVEIVPMLLHVGLGTFRPVKVENVEEHEMHSANIYDVTRRRRPRASTPHRRARLHRGRRGHHQRAHAGIRRRKTGVVAAGSGRYQTSSSARAISIRLVDALITNFHLPGSTLVMLVSALYDREHILTRIQNRRGAGHIASSPSAMQC